VSRDSHSTASLYIAACLAAASGSTPSQNTLPEIIRRVEPSTVLVLTFDGNGHRLMQGSGFFIDDKGDVVTNLHVLAGASKALVKTSEGKIHAVRQVVAEDRGADLVKLSIERPPHPASPIKVNDALPSVGEEILVIGNPMGLEQTVTNGIVSALRDVKGSGRLIQMTAPISAGSSGSPVVNLRGELIGVAMSILREGQNLNFAVPSGRIEALASGRARSFVAWAAAQKRPDSPEELCAAGQLFLSQMNMPKALAFFRQAIERDPRSVEAHYSLGCCLDAMGRLEGAAEAFQQTITLKPEFADAYYSLGNVQCEQGNFNAALENYQTALRLKPGGEIICNNMGIAYLKLDRLAEAVRAYQQAIRIKPDYLNAYNNLGIAFMRMKRYSEAAEAFKQAIRISPDDYEAHYNLGFTYAETGRDKEAMESFRQAIRLKPDSAAAHFAYGKTVLALGDRGLALEEYKVLKGLDKDLANKLFRMMYH
jgi:tetratricopeptide (TPR) repeat protein